MTHTNRGRVALLYPGDVQARREATTDNNRLSPIFRALAERGITADPAVYDDAFSDEVRQQLMLVDAVLVWVNPLQEGQGRSILDAMLREVAAAGVFVSTHPDIIQKIGTKDVLYQTRNMGWGCDTHRYLSLEQMGQELPAQLASGKARVLKQYRGNGGDGVWKIQLAAKVSDKTSEKSGVDLPESDAPVSVRHAKRGSVEEQMALGAFLERCESYFEAEGHMIDQAYQERLPEGMVRCYLVHDQVAGFGHQAINALYPAPSDTDPADVPQPGPRLYYPPTLPAFQGLKHHLEQKWVPEMQQLLDIETGRLPVLWDCDFLLGPKDERGEDTYVLCEINVSSVAPFPDSVVPYVADATAAQVKG